jgi:hypothetical protein
MHSCCIGPQISIVYNQKPLSASSGSEIEHSPQDKEINYSHPRAVESLSTVPTIFGQLDNLKKMIKDMRFHKTVELKGDSVSQDPVVSHDALKPQVSDVSKYSGKSVVDSIDILNELTCVNDRLQQLLQKV